MSMLVQQLKNVHKNNLIMARTKKTFKPMRNRKSGLKNTKRIKKNNEILKKVLNTP